MKDTASIKIAFIGFGNMACAMADGWIRSGAVSPECLGASSGHYEPLLEKTACREMKAFRTNDEAVEWADLVVLAVKPHLVADVVAPIAGKLTGKILLSVAVNIHFDDFEKILPPGISHLSLLPNTPVGVGEGISVCEAKHSLSEDEEKLVQKLLGALGLCVFADKKAFSAAGTLSGCGPAFAAMFIEALADGAVKHGVPRPLALSLASQMLAGTAKLQLASGAHPGVMKDAVCSPGGTTIIGVAQLERRGFRSSVIDAIDAIQNKEKFR